MPYERFTAWRSAHEVVLAVYRVTQGFPKNELYGLTSQMRRAAFSVAANIAEGAGRRGSTEFRRYLDIAVGSLTELSYSLLLARELEYLSLDDAARLEALREKTSKVTWGLYKLISKRANPGRSLSPPVRQSA